MYNIIMYFFFFIIIILYRPIKNGVWKNILKRIKALEKENAELKNQLFLADKEAGKGGKWYQNILDNIPNPVFIKNNNSRFVIMNQAFCDLVNKTKG